MVKGLSALNSLLQFVQWYRSKTWQTLFSTSCLPIRLHPLEELDKDPSPGGERDLLFPSTLPQDGPPFWHQQVGSSHGSNCQLPLVLPEPCSPHVALEVTYIYWAAPPPQGPESQLQGLLLQAPWVPAGVRHTSLQRSVTQENPIQASRLHKPKPLSAFCSARFQGLPIVMISLLALCGISMSPFCLFCPFTDV